MLEPDLLLINLLLMLDILLDKQLLLFIYPAQCFSQHCHPIVVSISDPVDVLIVGSVASMLNLLIKEN